MPLAVPSFLEPALAQPVAIFGGGVSGEGVCALLATLGVHGRIYDAQLKKGLEFGAGAAQQHRLVIYSPGFTPAHPWLLRARESGALCLGELDFASLFWRGRLLAVTGTNGKTTLTEFLTHALGASGREALATGNIGHPFSRLVADRRGGARETFAVCEVSSFQSETLQHFRPDAAFWTNFAEDHLERHGTLESYFSAKWRLVERALAGGRDPKSEVFVGSSVARFAQKFERPLQAVNVVPSEAQPTDPRLLRTVFASYPQRENFLLAAAWWRAAGCDEDALHAAARSFKLGRHRLARVTEHDGVTYWNDSKATNFHAVEAALAGFADPVVLIAGGKSKGGDLAGFVHRIAPRVKHMVLIGETSRELAYHCSTFRVAHTACGNFREAIRRAGELAAGGEHVLLSPGFASFDMFRNYEDRGDQFEALVQTATRTPAVSAASLG